MFSFFKRRFQPRSLRHAIWAAYEEAGFRAMDPFEKMRISMYSDRMDYEGQTIFMCKQKPRRERLEEEIGLARAFVFSKNAHPFRSQHNRGEDIGDGFRRVPEYSFLDIMNEEVFTTDDGQTIHAPKRRDTYWDSFRGAGKTGTGKNPAFKFTDGSDTGHTFTAQPDPHFDDGRTTFGKKTRTIFVDLEDIINPKYGPATGAETSDPGYAQAGFKHASKPLSGHYDQVEADGQTVFVPTENHMREMKAAKAYMTAKKFVHDINKSRPIDGHDLVREVPQDRGHLRLNF